MSNAAARRPRRWRGKAWIAIAIALVGVRARADTARVVLAQPVSPDDVVAEVATRVRAELAAARFDVIAVNIAPGANPREQIEAPSLEPRPVAALVIVRLEDRPVIDVWIVDRKTDNARVKRLDLGKRIDAELTSSLAIHAVELLRATLLETNGGPRSTDPSAASRKPTPREIGEGTALGPAHDQALFEGITLGVAGAVLHSFAGIGPAWAPAARVSWGTAAGFAGRLSIVGPAFGHQLEAPRGTAFVRQELAMIELVYAPSHRWLSPLASVGAGAYHLHTKGQPSNPRDRAAADDVLAALVDAGIGVGARLGARTAIAAELHAFVTQPAARVAIGDGADDAPIGPTGRPSFIASIGLQSTF